MFGRENKKGQAIKIPERVIPKNENPFAHIEEAEMKKINEKLVIIKSEEEKKIGSWVKIDSENCIIIVG